jgi:hypothetical protein
VPPEWWGAVAPAAAAPTPGELLSAAPAYSGPKSAAAATPADVERYIRSASSSRGIDPEVALRVVQSEGGLEPNRRGTFKTGSSWGPLQLHWGGKGYEHLGTVAGMGNTFTEKTGYQPGDPEAWQAATDYALDAAKQQGWGAWYGARKQGITGFQGINRGAPQPAPATSPPPVTPPGPPVAAPPTGTPASGAAPAWWTAVAGRAPAGAAGGGTDAPGSPGTVGEAPVKQAVAASWALSNLGSKDFFNLCQRFIEQAYGTGGQYGSAAAAGKALFKTANPAQADVGDLVFFRPDQTNNYAGHAAIYLGNGEMVGATNAGVTKDRIDSPYWKNLLVGFGDPPEAWKGRASSGDLMKGAGQLVGNAKAAVQGAAGAAAGSAPAWWGALTGGRT